MASGRPSRAKNPPSSSTTSTVNDKDERKILFASEWFWKPKGVASVLKRFEKEMIRAVGGINAVGHWMPENHIFQVHCWVNEVDAIGRMFSQILQDIITEEIKKFREAQYGNDNDSDDDEPDWWDDDNIEVVETEKIRKLEWTTDPADEEDGTQAEVKEEEEYEPKVELELQYPDDVKYYKHKHIWSCLDDLRQVLVDTDVIELQRLTACQLVITSGHAFIGGHEEKEVQTAIKKLEIIHKQYVATHFTPYLSHQFYTEGLEKVKYTLVPYFSMKKNYLKTTLLENERNYSILGQAVTIRSAEYDSASTQWIMRKPDPKISSKYGEDEDNGMKEWQAFSYASNGTLSALAKDVIERGFIVEPEAVIQNVTPITRPIQSINASKGVTDWFDSWKPEDNPKNQTLQNKILASKDIQTIETKREWDTYTPFGPKVVPDEANHTVVNMPVALAANLKTFQKPVTARVSQSAKIVVARQKSQPVQAVPTALPTVEPVTPLRARAASTILDPSLDTSHPPLRPQNLKPLPGKLISMEVQAPSVKRQVSSVRLPNPLFEDGDPLGLFVTPAQETSLLDDNISQVNFNDYQVLQPLRNAQVATENIQTVDEVQTRVFNKTMGQKAPKPNKFNPFAGRLSLPDPPKVSKQKLKVEERLADPLPAFERAMSASFELMMKDSQGLSNVSVSLEFGRIILSQVHPKLLYTKENQTTHAFQYLYSNLYNTPHGPITSFTKILTTIGAEANDLTKLKDSESRSIWKSSQVEWSVLYEFQFIDHTTVIDRVPFTVEINGETFSKAIKENRTLGDMYIHCGRRHWDFRIHAFCLANCSQACQKLANAIESSLYVKENQKLPDIIWEIDSAISGKFEFIGVQVRRQSRYQSHDEKSILVISEVQQLKHKCAMIQNLQVYQAKLADPKVKLSCYYEASITSASADDRFFKQNKDIELGEVGKWTEKDLTNIDAVQAMFRPACEMVKQMDSIGQENDNEVIVTAAPPGPQLYEKPAPYVFW